MKRDYGIGSIRYVIQVTQTTGPQKKAKKKAKKK